MRMNDDRKRQNEESTAPPRLVAALERLQKPRVVVPPHVDDAILSQARQYLCQSPGARQTGRWTRFWEHIRGVLATSRFNRPKLALGAAATIALVLFVWLAPFSPLHRANAGLEDVNHDGQVDILDAFALARRLQQGKRPQPQLDLNGDGMIDERDVLVIAAHAVRMD